MKEVKTLCPYCGVGCGLLVKTDGKQIVKVRGDPDHPANFGRICAKGCTVAQTVDVKTRARWAMLRESRDYAPAAVTPDRAVSYVADRLNAIREQQGSQ